MIHSENKDTGNKVLYLTLLFLILFVMIASRRPDIQGKITKPRDFKGLRKRSFFEMTFVEA